MQTLDFTDPVVDLVRWDNAQMVTLLLTVHCFDCQVNVDLASGQVFPIELLKIGLEYLKPWHLNELNRSVDLEFNEWNRSCLYQLEAGDPGLLNEELFQLLQSRSQSITFRYMEEIVQNGVINSYVNIAVLDCYPWGARSEQLDRYFPNTQHKLNSFVCDDSSFVKLVCFLVDQVAVFLNVCFYLARYLLCEVDLGVSNFWRLRILLYFLNILLGLFEVEWQLTSQGCGCFQAWFACAW